MTDYVLNMQMSLKDPVSNGIAKRHDDWETITAISSLGRSSLELIPNYRLTKAATRAEASPQARLLLVHLIGYLPMDQIQKPQCRFVVFPGNERLADELSYSVRSIQRLADELEDKGLIRRCYNGLNRRTGFDLTPLAMMHKEIDARLVAIHTLRKEEKNQRQLELSLSADRIERPVPTTVMSPQGDGSGTLNRPTDQIKADQKIATVLESVDTELIEKLCPHSLSDADKDRTGRCVDLREQHMLHHLTGSGRAGHIGWSNAKRAFGIDGAIALVTIAEEDPRRRATTDRYFGWLLKMAMTGDGHAIIEQAAERVQKKVDMGPKLTPPAERALPQDPISIGEQPVIARLTANLVRIADASDDKAIEDKPAQSSPTVLKEASGMKRWRESVRTAIGDYPYESMMSRVHMKLDGSNVCLVSSSQFVLSYLENTFGDQICEAISLASQTKDLHVRYIIS